MNFLLSGAAQPALHHLDAKGENNAIAVFSSSDSDKQDAFAKIIMVTAQLWSAFALWTAVTLLACMLDSYRFPDGGWNFSHTVVA